MIQPTYTTGHAQVYFRADTRDAEIRALKAEVSRLQALLKAKSKRKTKKKGKK